MGRPKKSTAEKRSEILALRLSHAEKSHIENQASIMGMTVPDYCRKLILKARFNSAAQGNNAKLIYELNKLGLQLAEVGGLPDQACDPSQFEALLNQLEVKLDEVAIDGS